MAITKIQSESLNLADTYDFTGTVTGAGGVNTPAFEAYDTSTQTISDYTFTKLDFATENFDTDSNFDNSAMRFTPTTSGKYFLFAKAEFDPNGYEDMRTAELVFYKNGSIVTYTNSRFFPVGNTTGGTGATPFISAIISLNGSSDYVEVYGRINTLDNSNGGVFNSSFGAYKIIE